MKTILPIAALLLALTVRLSMSQAPAQAPNPTVTGTIEGIITRSGTTEPIPGVTVQLNISNAGRGAGIGPDGDVLSSLTDEKGHFSFNGLRPGQYVMRYTLTGYFIPPNGVQSNVTVNAAARGNLLFALDTKQPAEFAITMIPGGVISGRVSDSNGRPIINGQMFALRVTYQDGQRTLSPVNNAMTNDRGEYRIYGLEPGEYYVRCQYRRTSNAPGGLQDTFRAYFPGVAEPNSASPVTVRSGTETSGTNIASRLVSTVTVSGTVIVPPSLEPTPPADIPLGARGGQVLVGVLSASTFYLVSVDGGLRDDAIAISNALSGMADRSAGKFEIHNVLPGRYDLYTTIRTNPADVQEQRIGHAFIDVGNQDLMNVSIPIQPGVELKARFTSTDAASVLQAPTQLTLRMRNGAPAVVQRAETAFGRGGARGSSEWRVYTGLPEGVYALDSPMQSLRDAYLADIRQGDRSIYETGTVVIGSTTPDPVELILAWPAGSIDATVLNASGKPAADAAVMLIPSGDRRQNLLLYKRGATNADGKVTLGALAPGSYKLFAWENIPNGAELNAEFMRVYEERGVPVTIEAGTPLKVQIPLISAGNP